MMAWVAAVVAVTPQRPAARSIRWVRKEKGVGVVVAVLHADPVPSDGAPVEPGRGAGLQPAHGEAQAIEPLGEALGRRIAMPPGLDPRLPAMDHAVEEGAGGEHDRAGAVLGAVRVDHAGHAAVLDDQVLHRRRADGEVRLGGQRGLHRVPVERPVDLRARPPHRRAARGVQQAELDARRRQRTDPSPRRARRSRGPDAPCQARRSPDCTTSRRSSRACA